jgi:hypothetical protein
MPASFQDISTAFEFANTGGFGEFQAFLCKRTGKIYEHSRSPDFAEFDEELPEDIGDEGKYIALPDKRELGLGKPLALSFACEWLPNDVDEISSIFDRRRAYSNFKDLLVRRQAIDRWYAFEAKATDEALRDWCEFNSIELLD